MSETEIIERNTELSAEFSRYVFDHPEIEESLPSDAEIVLLPDGDRELRDANRVLGRKLEAAGERVVYIAIRKLRPKSYSRIEELELVSQVV